MLLIKRKNNTKRQKTKEIKRLFHVKRKNIEIQEIKTENNCPRCGSQLYFLEPSRYDYADKIEHGFIDMLYCQKCNIWLFFQDAFLFYSPQFTKQQKIHQKEPLGKNIDIQ